MQSCLPPSLLLLPPSPKLVTRPILHAAYHSPLASALKFLVNLALPSSTILEIALPIALPHAPRAKNLLLTHFDDVESVLSAIYSLICVICASESIESEGPGGIDARVILLSSHDHRQDEGPLHGAGPVINYATLAISRRKWKYIFTVDGEVARDHAERYLNLARRLVPSLEGEVRYVDGGRAITSSPPDIIKHVPSHSPMKHTTVAVGGTFDHLHAGHKLLLTATALLLQHSTTADLTDRMDKKRLIVGITGDELLRNKKFREYLASWDERAKDVTEFLKSILLFVSPESEQEHISTTYLDSSDLGSNATRAIHTLLRPINVTIECVEIQDPFGPTITDETITGLAVSGETRSGGKAINEKRAERGWHALEVFEIAVLDSEGLPDDAGDAKQDFAFKISSSEIRKRQAERAGKDQGLTQ